MCPRGCRQLFLTHFGTAGSRQGGPKGGDRTATDAYLGVAPPLRPIPLSTTLSAQWFSRSPGPASACSWTAPLLQCNSCSPPCHRTRASPHGHTTGRQSHSALVSSSWAPCNAGLSRLANSCRLHRHLTFRTIGSGETRRDRAFADSLRSGRPPHAGHPELISVPRATSWDRIIHSGCLATSLPVLPRPRRLGDLQGHGV